MKQSKSGRPANDYQILLDALQEKYCGDHKARSMNQIILENPEYTGSIKTLSNTANERFGMSFAKYLKQIGVIRSGTEQAVETGGRCHFLWVTVDGENERIPCLTKSRALHGGELIEMCAPNDGKKAVGKVVQTSYYMKEKDLPCPMEKMYRYERRLSGEERKEAESLRKKYILCTIAGTAQYAFRCISTKEDLEIGDAVTVNNGRDGRIMSMKRISEKEAPEPIKKMPRVLAITDSLAEKRERSILQIEELEQKMGTEVFTRKEVDPQIRETMEQITYFSGVVLRGLADDIETIWHKLYLNPHFVEIRRGTEKYKVLLKADRKLSDSKRKIRKEVGQLACCNRLIRQVLTEYPRLKVICFAENWKTGEVYLAYSESGYDSFTSLRYLGKCDFRQRDHWTQIHDPAEDGFGFEGGRYTFEEKEAWEAFDYVLADGKRKLKAASPLPSAPYKKITSQTPSSIIKINN